MADTGPIESIYEDPERIKRERDEYREKLRTTRNYLWSIVLGGALGGISGAISNILYPTPLGVIRSLVIGGISTLGGGIGGNVMGDKRRGTNILIGSLTGLAMSAVVLLGNSSGYRNATPISISETEVNDTRAITVYQLDRYEKQFLDEGGGFQEIGRLRESALEQASLGNAKYSNESEAKIKADYDARVKSINDHYDMTLEAIRTSTSQPSK